MVDNKIVQSQKEIIVPKKGNCLIKTTDARKNNLGGLIKFKRR